MSIQPLGRHPRPSAPSTIDRYLELAGAASSVVAHTLASAPGRRVDDYVSGLVRAGRPSHPANGDLNAVVRRYAAPLLGDEVAGRASRELEALPHALTTNHQGVDYFAQSVQGTFIFSSRRDRRGNTPTSVPVFACGAVPLDNLTYPLGLLLYHLPGREVQAIPRKLPLFSNRHRRELVSVAPPIDESMVARALDRLAGLARTGEVDPRLCSGVEQILVEDYRCPAVLDLPGYSEQSVVLNHRIWKRLVGPSGPGSDLVYLELERITAGLLALDLADPDGLVSSILFQPALRDRVLEALEGATGCWRRLALDERLTGTLGGSRRHLPSGTVFFWGINQRGRRVPLCLRCGELRGVDEKAEPWSHPFTPEDLLAGLEAGRILPSLFTCFLCITFARGVSCLGGYHQAQYLPHMRDRLVDALELSRDYRMLAEQIRGTEASGYLAGMQCVMKRLDDGALVPAGPAEIVAHGGLRPGELDRARSVTVRDAHIASLLETLPELSREAVRGSAWQGALARECAGALDDRVLVI